MSDIPFLSFDDPDDVPGASLRAGSAGGFAPALDVRHHDGWDFPPDADAERAAAVATAAGCEAARTGRWAAAAESLAASAGYRTALVARGQAAPAVAARGWSDVAVLAAARDDAVGAADALARARAFAAEPSGVSAAVSAALDDVATWLGALGGAAAPVASRETAPVTTPPTPSPTLLGDLAADFATALVIEPIVPEPFAPAVVRAPTQPPFAELPAESPFAGSLFAGSLFAGSLFAEHSAVEVDADEPLRFEPAFVDVTAEVIDREPDVFGTEWDVAEIPPAAELAVEAPEADQPAAADAAPDVVFLTVDHADHASPAPQPAADAPKTAAARDAALPWLDLEGPVRDWERADYVPPAPLPPPTARPVAPLAPPLAPALRRNHKIDEAVALATAAPDESPGRLRGLLRRFRKG